MQIKIHRSCNREKPLFRKAQLEMVSCYCCQDVLKCTHTQTARNHKQPPSTTLTREVFWYRRRKMPNQEQKIISADYSKTYGQDLTCSVFQAQKSDSRLACNFSCNITSVTSPATPCRNPSQQSPVELGKGPLSQLHLLPTAGRRALTSGLSTGPSSIQQPRVSFLTLKKEPCQHLISIC